jgi:glycosyltransferase involved in cell wall biosynthesis
MKILVRQDWPHAKVNGASYGYDIPFSIISREERDTRTITVPWNTGLANAIDEITARLCRIFSPINCRRGKNFRASHEIACYKILRDLSKNPEARVLIAFGEPYLESISKFPCEFQKRISLCLHQPPEWLKNNVRSLDVLFHVNSIIAISQEQSRFLRGYNKQTHVVRLGVSLDLFRPNDSKGLTDQPHSVLCVGEHLRDFGTASKVVELVSKRFPDVTFTFIVSDAKHPPTAISHLMSQKNISVSSNLSQLELVREYQRATVFFLPLLDSTSNTALVEAIASGLPIVATRVGGTPDYTTSKFAKLCNLKNPQLHSEAICDYLTDSGMRNEHARNARDWAMENLNWVEFAKTLRKVI